MEAVSVEKRRYFAVPTAISSASGTSFTIVDTYQLTCLVGLLNAVPVLILYPM